jgi:CRP-like cAMP-binding protein
VLSYLRTQSLEEGEVLFRQGAASNRIYFVVHGYLALVEERSSQYASSQYNITPTNGYRAHPHSSDGASVGTSGSSEDDTSSFMVDTGATSSSAEARLELGLEYDSEDSRLSTPKGKGIGSSSSSSSSSAGGSSSSSSSSSSSRRDVRIRKLGPGCILGSSEFLMNQPFHVYTARSVAPRTVLLGFLYDDFAKLEKASPVAAMMLYKETAYFLARKNAQSKRQVNFGLFS